MLLYRKFQIKESFVLQIFSSERNEIFLGIAIRALGNNL